MEVNAFESVLCTYMLVLKWSFVSLYHAQVFMERLCGRDHFDSLYKFKAVRINYNAIRYQLIAESEASSIGGWFRVYSRWHQFPFNRGGALCIRLIPRLLVYRHRSQEHSPTN